MSKKVYVLTRTLDGDAIVDGVFTTERKVEEYLKYQLEQFGESYEDYEDGNSDYDFEIHQEELN